MLSYEAILDSSYVGKVSLTGLCPSSHVQRLYGSTMSASSHHTQSAAILLLGKIPALPGKRLPCFPLHIGLGELASASLYASLSPTLR